MTRAALAAFLRHFPKDGTLDRETGHVARHLASAVERLDALLAELPPPRRKEKRE